MFGLARHLGSGGARGGGEFGGAERRRLGRSDLINGPNFLSMLQQGLLYGPVVDRLPNAALNRRIGKPTTMTDFTVPTGGYEVPWRMARVVFVYDSARVPAPAALDGGDAAVGRRPSRPPDAPDSSKLPRRNLPETGAVRIRARQGGAANPRHR